MTYNVFSGTLNPTHSLGSEVGLGPGDIVSDVTELPTPQKKGAQVSPLV